LLNQRDGTTVQPNKAPKPGDHEGDQLRTHTARELASGDHELASGDHEGDQLRTHTPHEYMTGGVHPTTQREKRGGKTALPRHSYSTVARASPGAEGASGA